MAEQPIPPLPPQPCPKCGAQMSPRTVSNGMNKEIDKKTGDIRGYICDICGYQENADVVNERPND